MALFERMERRPAAVTVACVGLIVSLLMLHYGTAIHRLGLHDLMRGLFYLPVAVAAVAAGWRGGVVTASVAGIGYIPHIRQLEQAGDRAVNNGLELALMLAVGALVGAFADASRRSRFLAAERGRMAALGEVGLGMMLQTQRPLAAIEGQAESLRALARRATDLPVEFAARIIQGEAARVGRLMSDLRALGSVDPRRPGSVDLSSLATGIVGDLAAQAGYRVTLGPVVEGALIHADRRKLAWALRSLLSGLLVTDPPPRRVEVNVTAGEKEAILGIRADFGIDDAPDLQRSLSDVFGVATTDYQFQRALCLHLLIAEGGRVGHERLGRHTRLVRVGFAISAHRRRRPSRSHRAAQDAQGDSPMNTPDRGTCHRPDVPLAHLG